MIKQDDQKPDQEIPELIKLQEASKMLKVHPNTLRQWDKNGLLPAIRIGEKKERRYKKDDIINFLKQK
jgi:excisionase family DNA binding protein